MLTANGTYFTINGISVIRRADPHFTPQIYCIKFPELTFRERKLFSSVDRKKGVLEGPVKVFKSRIKAEFPLSSPSENAG
jgi:hypothetical protein